MGALKACAALATASALALLTSPALAQKQILEDRPVTQETLLDRIQIEDFLTRYYYDLSVGKAHELAEYFTEDAVLDVDGVVAKGHKEIAKLYERPEGANSPGAKAQYRRGNMLLTNPIINVQGDVATAHVIWTGVMNEGVGKPPRLYEQGREYTELRKVNGKWLISRRFISSDSGLPDRFDSTWTPREHR
ncbi:MAG: nuclear transport factor 2 family protein [Steroidobacteraceae bacterium]|nr:nuclear transport factor 2 family protein [Steroidobacteraceae bacterium]